MDVTFYHAHIGRGSTWRDLADAMRIHPTFGEGLPSLARLMPEALGIGGRHKSADKMPNYRYGKEFIDTA